MKSLAVSFAACAAFGFCSCEKHRADAPSPRVSEQAAAEPKASEDVPPPPETAGVADAGPVGAREVEAVANVDLDPRALENQRVKAEVLKRIDVMPGLTPEEKDKLYVQVDRARAMGKVITIPFPSGGTSISAEDASALGDRLKLPQIEDLTADPTVVFVILGFADKKGDPSKNAAISRARADSVLAALRDRFRVMNVMHAVGMGSSEMFDADNLDKNRVVELWAVLP